MDNKIELIENKNYNFYVFFLRPHFNIPMAHPRDPTRDLLREISSRDVRGDLRGISGILITFFCILKLISVFDNPNKNFDLQAD